MNQVENLIPDALRNSKMLQVVATDLEGKYIYCSPSFTEKFSFLSNNFIGQLFQLSIHPDDVEKSNQASHKLIVGETQIERLQIRKPSYVLGNYHWTDWEFRLLLDNSGQTLGILCIGFEITEKVVSSLLEDSEKRFRFYFEKSPVGIVYLSKEGVILECNPFAAEIVGRSLSELKGAPVAKFEWMAVDEYFNQLKPEQHPAMQAMVTNTEIANQVMGIYHAKKQSLVWLEINAIPVRNASNEVVGAITLFTDVTDRKKIKDELAKANQEIKGLLSEMQDVIFSYDHHTKELLYISENATSFFGVNDLSFFENYYWRDALVHPEDKQFVEQVYVDLETKGWYDREYRVMLPKHDSVKWINTRGQLRKNSSTGKISFDGVITDITDRKITELALKESEEKYRFLVDNTHDLLYQFNIAGEPIYLSKSVKTISGYDEQDVMGKPFTDFIFKEDLPQLMVETERLLSGLVKVSNSRYRIYAKDGSIRWHSATNVPNYDKQGNIVGFSGIAKDVTEAVFFEQKLIESEEKYRSLIENSQDIVFKVDVEGVILFVSPAFEKLLGYKMDEYLNTKLNPLIHPDDLSDLYAAFEKSKVEKTKNSITEYRVLHKEGHYLWFTANFSPVVSGKKVLGYQGFVRLIQEKKTQELEQKRLMDVIVRQNSLLQNYAYIVSHNLRTHSVNLKLMADMMPSQIKGVEEHSYFQLFKKATNSLEQTIQDLTEVAEIHLNNDSAFCWIDMDEVIENGVNNISQVAAKAKVEIRRNNLSRCKIWGIKSYVESIVINLLSNAIKYCDYQKDSQYACISLEYTTGNKVQLKVQDNGLGLDLKLHKNNIFKMNKTFHDVKDSRGIGLFITKNQVEFMGGSIWVESEKGVGSCFIVEFNKAEF
ncbi:MAG: PAS domain S-box protein [Luteibaculaceae bacterium]